MDVCDAINERNEKVQAGRQYAMELTEPLNDPRRLLRHYADTVVDGTLDAGGIGADWGVGRGGVVVGEGVGWSVEVVGELLVGDAVEESTLR